MFSNAKLDDRKYLDKLTKQTLAGTGTMFVTDKSYHAMQLEELVKETGNCLITGKKKSKYTNTWLHNLIYTYFISGLGLKLYSQILN